MYIYIYIYIYLVILCVCVCVCVFSSHPFWTSSSLDVPAGVTQEEGHTGFLIHHSRDENTTVCTVCLYLRPKGFETRA